MYKLRPYQQEAVDKGAEFINAKAERGGAIMVLPTAAGKSLIIASICKQLSGKTLVLQPSKEILEQNLAKAKAFGIEDIAVFSASMRTKELGNITFATIGSIINCKELFSEFEHLIIDECHLVNSKGGMYEKFIEYFGNKVLGVTATPYRLHSYSDMHTGQQCVVAKMLHRTRPRIFNKIIHITQIQELYEQGFLCPIEYGVMNSYEHGEIPLNTTGMDFDKKAMFNYNKGKNVIENVAKIIRKESCKHILVFTASVKEAEELSWYLDKLGITAATISATTKKKDREDVLERFIAGEIRVVTNCGTLTCGFDFPELDCVIIARPTQSVALYYQIMGRGIRIAPGKKKVKILDMCGNLKRFGRIEDFKIIEGKKGMHRLIGSKTPLTGFDFIANQDLEATNYAGKEESVWSPNSGQIMPFGKFKGVHVTKIPQWYVDWAVENIGGPIKAMFERENERRLARDNEKRQKEDVPF